MYRRLNLLNSPLRLGLENVLKYHKFFLNKVHIESKIFSTFNPHNFAKLDSIKVIKTVNKEYAAVCALLHRSGLNDFGQLPNYLNKRNFHSSPRNLQDAPKQSGGPGGQKPDKEDEDKDKISSLLAKAFLWMLTAYMVIAIISLMFPSSSQPEVVRYVAWNEFLYQMLAKGEVEEIIVRPDIEIVTIVLYDGAVVKGKRVENRTYHMNVVDVNKFEDKLREAERRMGIHGDGVPIIYERSTDTAGKLLISLLVVAILISLLARSKSIRPPISMDTFTQLGRAKFTLVDPLTGPGKGVHFSDVAGLREAKIEVKEFVDYLKRPEHYKSLGAKVPKGALLLGPPGCGKTLLAKAVATEANVPFLSMNGSEFIEMIGGLGAARVRDLFKEARKRAPCIIYIDEIDAVGRKKKWAVRFRRCKWHILIDYPDLMERKEIFEQHLKSISLEHAPNTYSKRLAYLTPGFSGADIANVCNESALHAARFKKSKVTKDDLEYAVERLVGGTEKRNHAMSLHEKRVIAYHESGHALVGWMLEHTDALLKNDLEKVTKMAYAQVREYGMNNTIGLISFPEEETKELGKRPYSKMLTSLIDIEVRNLVTTAYKHTEQVLLKHKDKLVELSETLFNKETLNYEDVEKLLGPPPYGRKKLIDPAEFEENMRKDAGDYKAANAETNTSSPRA
ncbi:hypothetical protein NQ314_001722 [Rhamnusium bicolor]|uniref:AAA+ ATPase domain-containing protein n=1 Tax=Rhamnusium bicolor TaxID=1586634 RepID=A0AAV8ZTI6_9CUCU|nr:hypothetical protein NQ314_001722 [Rhamnusium bicolor]